MDIQKAISAYRSKSDAGSTWSERIEAGLLAAAPYLQAEPAAQPQEQNKCLDCGCSTSYCTGHNGGYAANPKPAQSQPPADVVEAMREAYNTRNGMPSALEVAREGYVSLEDVRKAAIAEALENMKFGRDAADIFADKLCARLTPKERVTIERWIHNPERWIVLRNGWNPGNHDGFKDRKDAERYAAGLRAEIGEQ